MTSVAQKNYDKYNKANSYDSYIFKKTHVVRINKSIDIVRQYLGANKDRKKILDVGCGDGQISVKFKELGLEVYGIDIASSQVKEAKKRGVVAIEGDFQNGLPYDNKSFDIVFCGEVVEHLVDVRFLITEINRILVAGGLLVLTTPNLAGFNDRVRFIFGINPRHCSPLSKDHSLHIRPFTLGSLRTVLEKGGFNVTKFCSNKIRVSPFEKHEYDSYFLANYFPGFGAALIIGAIKEADVDSIELIED